MTMNKVKTLDDLKKMRELFVRLWICVKKAIPLISSYKLRFLWPLAV